VPRIRICGPVPLRLYIKLCIGAWLNTKSALSIICAIRLFKIVLWKSLNVLFCRNFDEIEQTAAELQDDGILLYMILERGKLEDNIKVSRERGRERERVWRSRLLWLPVHNYNPVTRYCIEYIWTSKLHYSNLTVFWFRYLWVILMIRGVWTRNLVWHSINTCFSHDDHHQAAPLKQSIKEGKIINGWCFFLTNIAINMSLYLAFSQ